MKPIRTLILMASEGRMRLAENGGVGKGLAELRTVEKSDIGGEPRGYADAEGRGQAAPGMAGHKFERPTSEREQARDAFSNAVIEMLEAQWHDGSYDRLVIAAPPRMLGALRADLPAHIAEVLHADLDKDLTKIPLADLPSHLDRVLAL